MHSYQKGRRNFLASLAILSAGAAIAGPGDVLAMTGGHVTELERSWKSFCKKYKGKYYDGTFDKTHLSKLIQCKGHKHKVGQAMAFTGGAFIAFPTWIFSDSSKNAFDLIITFLKPDNTIPERIISINRFELEALNNFEEFDACTLISTLMSNSEQFKKSFHTKVYIKKRKAILIKNNIGLKEKVYSNTVSYNI